MDIDALLSDIEPDFVCGKNDPHYDESLVKYRNSIFERTKEEGKPQKSIHNWSKVEAELLKLCEKAHSLEVVVFLTVVWMHKEGYEGLSKGTELIAEAINRHWDCLYPELDSKNEIPRARLNKLNTFTSFDFIQSFKRISSKAINTGDIENNIAFIDQSLTNFERMTTLFNEKVNDSREGDVSESYIDFTRTSYGNGGEGIVVLLEELKDELSNNRQKDEVTEKDTDPEENHKQSNQKGHNMSNSNQVVHTKSSQSIQSRQDAIDMLSNVEKYFKKNEPGSPVPLLLRRAKRLIDKDFLWLIENLAPAGVREVENVLGITVGELMKEEVSGGETS